MAQFLRNSHVAIAVADETVQGASADRYVRLRIAGSPPTAVVNATQILRVGRLGADRR